MQKRMEQFDWSDLQSFLAIAEEGNLSAAARRLGVTQPTMGRRLKAMEARLGTRLLEAVPGGFALTAAGEAIRENVARADAELRAAGRRIGGADLRIEGVVRITTVDILASEVVAPALAALRREHPGIALEVLPDMRHLSLSKREADLALRVAPFEGHSLFARKVGTLAHGLYAARDLVAARPDIADWRGRGPLVTVLEDQMHLTQVQWFHRLAGDTDVALRTNDRALQVEAAAAGLGLACLPSFIGDRHPGLAHVTAGEAGPARDIWLGVHSDMRQMPRIRLVIEALVAQCKAAGL